MILERGSQTPVELHSTFNHHITWMLSLLQHVTIYHAACIPNLRLTLLEEPEQAIRVEQRLTAEKDLASYFENFAIILDKLQTFHNEVLSASYWELCTRYSSHALAIVADPNKVMDEDFLKDDIILGLLRPAQMAETEFCAVFNVYLTQWQGYRENDAVFNEVAMWQPLVEAIQILNALVEARMAELEGKFVEAMTQQLLANEVVFDNLINYLQEYSDENTLAHIRTIAQYPTSKLQKLNIGWLQLFRNDIDRQLRRFAVERKQSSESGKINSSSSFAEEFIVALETAALDDQRNFHYLQEYSNPLLVYSLQRIELYLAYAVAQNYVRQHMNTLLEYMVKPIEEDASELLAGIQL